MAWSTPPTVVTGDIITASWGNTVRDLLRYLKGLDGAVTIDAALTATSFTGGGSGLTGIPAAQITGSLTANQVTFKGAVAGRSTNWAVPMSDTNVPWDSAVLADTSIHSTSTNNERLTVPTGWGGKWHVFANLYVIPGGSDISVFARLFDTAVQIGNSGRRVLNTTNEIISFSRIVDLSAGDYVNIQMVAGASGTNLASASQASTFGMFFVGT